MSPGAKKERWLGGPIRYGKRGPVFMIERWVNGRHYHVSTKCRTERAALKELERFEADPAGYRTARKQHTTGLPITPELVADYLLHLKHRQVSEPAQREAKRHLAELVAALDGRDFRRIGLSGILAILDELGPVARWNRTKVLKAFASWLRRDRGLLTRADDPTLDVKNLVQTPEKSRRRKAMAQVTVELAISKMEQPFRDIAIVLAGTGMHISELIRFHGGEGQLLDPPEWQKGQGVLAALVIMHKSGEPHAMAITQQSTLDALRRIQKLEKFPHRSAIGHHDTKVSAAIGAKFSMGWLRHSVATWLAMKRVSYEDIASQLGHANTKMAKRIYVDLGLTAHPKPIPALRLVKG